MTPRLFEASCAESRPITLKLGRLLVGGFPHCGGSKRGFCSYGSRSYSGRTIPIAGDREVAVNTEREDDVGKSRGVGVGQEELTVAIDADRVYPISVPITGYRLVACDAINEGKIRKASRVAVLQKDDPVTRPEHSTGSYPVTVPISRNCNVAGIPQGEY